MTTLEHICRDARGPVVVSRATWHATFAFVITNPNGGGYFVFSFRRETGEWLGTKLLGPEKGGEDGFYVVRDHKATARALKHAAAQVARLQALVESLASQAQQAEEPWGPGRSGVASPTASEASRGDAAESGAPGRALGDREELAEPSPPSDRD